MRDFCLTVNRSHMRKIYPKLITTLFLVLFAAMVIKYVDADSKTPGNSTPGLTSKNLNLK